MLILVLTTVAAVGYLYLTRGGSSAVAGGLVGSEQRVVKAADTITAAATKVQRFTELHTFDTTALAQISAMYSEHERLKNLAAGASGAQKTIADQAVSDVAQAIDGAERYRRAIAVTYRLADADAASRELHDAVASLQQQAQAWQHA